MILGKQNILQWFNSLPQEVVFWRLYQPGQKQLGYATFESKQNENLTKADSLEDLRQCLALLHSGKYTINAQEKPGNVVKGSYVTDFEISFNEVGNNSASQHQISGVVNVPAVGYVTKEEALQLAEEKFLKLMNEKELADLRKENSQLKKENKELEESANSPLNQIAGMVIPMLTKQQPLAAVGTLDTANDEEQNNLNRLQMVLDKTEKIFGEPSLPFLEKLIGFIEMNPAYVNLIKGFVK